MFMEDHPSTGLGCLSSQSDVWGMKIGFHPFVSFSQSESLTTSVDYMFQLLRWSGISAASLEKGCLDPSPSTLDASHLSAIAEVLFGGSPVTAPEPPKFGGGLT